MPSPDELLAAIGRDPDNDALRLEYSELLAQARRQDPQAEFIRAEVELARMPPEDPRREKLAARAQALWRKHQTPWSGACPAWARSEHLESERGFLANFKISVRDWCQKAPALLRSYPVHRLQIRDTRPDLAKLTASEDLRYVRILDLCYEEVGDAGAALLAASPYLSELTGLLLFRTKIGQAGAEAIADSKHLTRLTWLSLEENDVKSEGAIALARSPRFKRLRFFSLRSNRIDAHAGQKIGTSGMLASLERLRMGYMEIGPTGSAAILSAAMPKLEALEFDYNAMGDEGAAAFAESAAGRSRLAELDMSYNKITAAGMKKLAASRAFAYLTRLRFGNPIGPEGLRYLARSKHLKRLRALDLYQAEVGDEGAKVLAASPMLAQLEELCLGDTGIGPKGAIALAESPYMGGLKRLELRGNPLDAASRKALRAKFGRRAV